MVKHRFVDLEKGYAMVHKESLFDDEEYTMLLPGDTCHSCEKKKIEEEKERKRQEVEEKKREQAWRECMVCNIDIDNCTIL